MILKAPQDQFTIDDKGQLLWQSKSGSPLPGDPVATLSKGDNILKPDLALIDGAALKDVDQGEAKAALLERAQAHIASILEPLVALGSAQAPNDSVRALFDKVHSSLGILPREEVEPQIAALDTDTRRAVRQAGIKLGPVLVFMPALNKPAAVRMRAMLWSLYNDKPLPAPVPRDGVVSEKIEDDGADPQFYRAIGYPLYGPRAVRIDMLDRVISAVYDNADKGKFQAKHQMAEWLGSPIEDLYAVLEAMGHSKIYDPADHVKEDDVEEGAAKAEPKSEEGKEEDSKDGDDKAAESSSDKPAEEKPQEQVKPALATFRLKRGQAHKKGAPKRDNAHKSKKPTKKQQKQNRADKKKRVMSAGDFKTKPEDSPFAVLEQLKGQVAKK